MVFEDLLYEKHGHIAVVTLQRPLRLNAFGQQMLREYLAVLDDVGMDGAIRVLVITGSGRSFSSGEDLAEMDTFIKDRQLLHDAYQHLQTLQEVTRRMVHLPKILIAAVNGIAVGLGAELAIASDIRLASENASFSFAEVKRGLFETNGVTYFLPRLVGQGRALEMMLTGEKISAHSALEAGLVTHVLAQEDLLTYALELAQTIAHNAPLTVQLIKQTLKRTYDLDLEAMMQIEVNGMLCCLGSEDLQEGLQAFFEKRTPLYQGK